MTELGGVANVEDNRDKSYCERMKAKYGSDRTERWHERYKDAVYGR